MPYDSGDNMPSCLPFQRRARAVVRVTDFTRIGKPGIIVFSGSLYNYNSNNLTPKQSNFAQKTSNQISPDPSDCVE